MKDSEGRRRGLALLRKATTTQQGQFSESKSMK